MKTTLFALITAVLAVTAGCNKVDRDVEAARQAETFPSSPTAKDSWRTPTPAPANRVGVDVDVDRTKNGYTVDADGYRVDSRGQRIGSPTNDLGDDVVAGADHASDRAVASGHNLDNAVKSDAVGDLDLGRTLNAKGDVADRTQQFKVGDAIVASIDADNLASGTALVATLKTEAGKVVATAKGSTSKGGENASFKLGKAPAAGDYVLTVSGPAGEIESQSFSIRD